MPRSTDGDDRATSNLTRTRTMIIKERPRVQLALSQFEPPEECLRIGHKPEWPDVSLYLPENVIEKIFHHAQSHRRIEVGGYLFGHAYVEGHMAAVRVEGVYPIVS